MRSAVRFQLPPELEAATPPEARGLRRDHVRLLAVDRATGSVGHHRFRLPGCSSRATCWWSTPAPGPYGQPARPHLPGRRFEVRLAARDGERWAALVLGVPADGTDPALVPTDPRPAAPPLEAGERD